jgi:branched-chain amino acid transport system substrate-binding protein
LDGLDRRGALGLLAGIGAASLTGGLSACSVTADNSSKSPIRVGLLVPMSGANKAIGTDLHDGFQLYLKQNANTLSGHSVDLVIEEEGESAESGATALKRLHDGGVLAVVGVGNSELLAAIRDTVEKSQIPLLAAHASPADMPSAVYVWRTGFVNDEPGQAIATYLKPRGGVGLIGLNNAFGIEVMAGFGKVYGAQDTVWVPATGNPSVSSFAAYTSQLSGKGLRSIFACIPSNYVVPFLDSMKAFPDLKQLRVYSPGQVAEGVALDQLGAKAAGLFTAMPYSADLDNAANRNFSANFQTDYLRTPSAYAVASYDAAAVLDRAITLCGNATLSHQQLNQMIPQVGLVVSPRGNWQFTQNRSPQQKWYLREVHLDGPILSNVLISDLATLGS